MRAWGKRARPANEARDAYKIGSVLAWALASNTVLAGPVQDGLSGASCQPHPDARQQDAAVSTEAPRPQHTWSAEEIRASRTVDATASALPPTFETATVARSLIVEDDGHRLAVFDGERIEPIAARPPRFGVHGSPQFSPDGRFAYWATRDGWVTQFDLWHMKTVAATRVGHETHGIAVSSDGRHVLAANVLPRTLVALDANGLALEKTIPVAGLKGTASRIAALHDAGRRNSFIVVLQDVPEIWEIPYDGRPVYKGLVHDYRLKEGIPETGPLPVRRIELEDSLDDVFLDPNHDYLVGRPHRQAAAQLIHLGVGRKIGEVALPEGSRLDGAVGWARQHEDGTSQRVVAAANLGQASITLLDLKGGKLLATLPTPGASRRLYSHDATPYLWVDVCEGPLAGTLRVIDKQTLERVADLAPAPGAEIVHVGFDRHGKRALVALRGPQDELVVYDARTLTEIRRLPVQRPAGSYTLPSRTQMPGDEAPSGTRVPRPTTNSSDVLAAE